MPIALIKIIEGRSPDKTSPRKPPPEFPTHNSPTQRQAARQLKEQPT
ncbi:hypothetical protein ABID97_005602 [Variovorax sp. OAS795]